MRRPYAALAPALAVLVGVLFVGRSSAVESARVERAKVAELTAYRLALQVRVDRLARDSAKVATDKASAIVRAGGNKVDASLAYVRQEVAQARVILRDTLSTLAEVRQTATVLADSVDALLFVVADYRASVDTLTIRHAEERAASDRALQSSHEALLASNAALNAWKSAAKRPPWYRRIAQTACVGLAGGAGGGIGSALAGTEGAAVGALSGVVVGAVACR